MNKFQFKPQDNNINTYKLILIQLEMLIYKLISFNNFNNNLNKITKINNPKKRRDSNKHYRCHY